MGVEGRGMLRESERVGGEREVGHKGGGGGDKACVNVCVCVCVCVSVCRGRGQGGEECK